MNSQPAVDLDVIDAATASAADLDDAAALEAAEEAAALPARCVPPVAHLRAEFVHQPTFRHRRWVMARDGNDLLGRALCAWEDIPENRDQVYADVTVRSDARGRGVGSALTAAVAREAAAFGAKLVNLDARVGGPGEPFLIRAGAQRRMVERRSVCMTSEIDRTLLESWVAKAPERASGYTLLYWNSPCPEDLLDDYVALRCVMNTAPLEELEREDDAVTPERWREYEALWAARDASLGVVCARHDATGALVGLTEILSHGTWPEMVAQEDTGVWPAHRDRGLGRWLKAAMALRLLSEHPEVGHIETWNAGSNAPMLGINAAMGFRALEDWGNWQVPTADLLCFRGP